MIKAEFKEGAGMVEVLQGDYKLLDGVAYETELSSQNWQDSIRPGMTVVMSVWLRRLEPSQHGDHCVNMACGGTLIRRYSSRKHW